MIDAYGKGSFVVVSVFCYHGIKAEFVGIFLAHRHTDQALAVRSHHVEIFGSCKLSGTNHVAFVFPVFVVTYKNNSAPAQIFKCFLN